MSRRDRGSVSLRGQQVSPSDKIITPCDSLGKGGQPPPTPLSAVGRYASTPFAGPPRNAPSMRAANERDARVCVPYMCIGI